MIKVILAYIIIQLITTAYGVSVIESVKPIVEKKLDDDGYILKNKNSMYKFNSKLEKVLKGFIPFYYAIKAINLIKGGDPVKKAYKQEIEDGNYVTRNELEEELARQELAKNFGHIKVSSEPNVAFEKSEKYVARHNDFNLLETNPKDVKYEIIEDKDNDLSITPFKKIEKKIVINNVTYKDVVKAIMKLNIDQLYDLLKCIQDLINIRRNNKSLKLEKSKI